MNPITLSPEAEKALQLWLHYQDMLVSDKVTNHVHRKYIMGQEHRFRELFLYHTEPQAETVMRAAGCVLIQGTFNA